MQKPVDERRTEVLVKPERYRVPRSRTPVDVYLDGNEGAPPPARLLAGLSKLPPDVFRRYPDARALEEKLAARHGVDPARVIATAGADDAIERLCRIALRPGRSVVLPSPTFEMLERYADASGARVARIAWPGARYPAEEVIAAAGDDAALVAVVSPNNPTGAVATAGDLRRLSAAVPRALLLVDLAYGEFADEDLAPAALALPNAVVLKTFSKAYGLAGVRVGYAAGPPGVIDAMRAVAPPYAVSGVSIEIVSRRLDDDGDVPAFVARVRRERDELTAALRRLGRDPKPSQGNFVLCRVADALWMRDAMAGMGIAVRCFPDIDAMAGAVRITCPGDAATFARLQHALETVLSPEAILFDLDGVLADAARSYDAAILETARRFGAAATEGDIAAVRAAGDANNDWEVTRRLLERSGVHVPLAGVTEVFESIYQGTPENPGLYRHERRRVDGETLRRLARRLPLGVVTGRPRRDAERFLGDHGLAPLFATVVCREDAPRKPDPAPVRLAMDHLAVTRAWMAGDTPDDARAARRAGVLPIGIVTGDDGLDASQIAAGAARLIGNAGDVLDRLEGIA